MADTNSQKSQRTRGPSSERTKDRGLENPELEAVQKGVVITTKWQVCGAKRSQDWSPQGKN